MKIGKRIIVMKTKMHQQEIFMTSYINTTLLNKNSNNNNDNNNNNNNNNNNSYRIPFVAFFIIPNNQMSANEPNK